ncbi:hypothetical protein AD006_31015 (plasmid) [Pseudonocardia sp. EC080610-09]|nr:hypothetical protein AD006_31015 [Pseudonocardia sp. EC080610-09]ALL85420.1 hypothetical protein AD017_30215 [Pseudonocardia sp. EC080619-01]
MSVDDDIVTAPLRVRSLIEDTLMWVACECGSGSRSAADDDGLGAGYVHTASDDGRIRAHIPAQR